MVNQRVSFPWAMLIANYSIENYYLEIGDVDGSKGMYLRLWDEDIFIVGVGAPQFKHYYHKRKSTNEYSPDEYSVSFHAEYHLKKVPLNILKNIFEYMERTEKLHIFY